ncbi:PEGA domain-containing protein [Anaerotignum sp.]|uniref:PEGA domain-containing protein n=1 Tax=Anaerotignum sp. TaxID=2039241 RepID=UPI003329AD8D
MKDYHFERDDHEFDQTIRLDDINEELKKLEKEKEQVEDDLGDKDAFLDAFESEKFDMKPVGSEPEIAKSTDGKVPPNDGDEPFLNKKTVAIVTAVAVVVAIACFALVRGMFPSGNKDKALAQNEMPMLIQGVLDGGELIVYDIKQDVNKSIAITEETVLTNEQGQISPEMQFNAGDLVLIGLDKDGKNIINISLGGEIHTIEETGLTADTAAKQLVAEGKKYSYREQTMFLYNQEEVNPKELEACDVLVLKSYDNIVWSVDVAEYHGYISVENKDNIVNGKFKLDEEEEVALVEVERIPVKEGTHTITVSGDNIEKRTDSVFVETGEVYVYDLSKAQEKVGVLIINANVTDYKLYINGTLVDSTVPSVLPLGEYDVVILKNGYTEWSQHIKLDSDTLSIDAELQKDIQFGTVVISSNVDGAQLYIDGKEMGVSPLEMSLPYGSYNLEVYKSGYEPFSTTVWVNSSSTHVKVELERE